MYNGLDFFAGFLNVGEGWLAQNGAWDGICFYTSIRPGATEWMDIGRYLHWLFPVAPKRLLGEWESWKRKHAWERMELRGWGFTQKKLLHIWDPPLVLAVCWMGFFLFVSRGGLYLNEW